MLCAELKIAVDLGKKCPSNYLSMVLQALAMGFFNSSAKVFQIIEAEGMTIPVFQNWLTFMPNFKYEFELRRIIIALSAIIRTPVDQMPPLVAEREPELTKQLSVLSDRVFKKRIEIVEDNEKHLKEGGDGDEMDEDDDEDIDDEAEFEKTVEKLSKFKDGKYEGDSDFEDDEDDSDYEYNAGDMALYDSNLDDTDELLFLKETLDIIYNGDQALYQRLVSGMTADELNALIELLGKAPALKEREEKCRE